MFTIDLLDKSIKISERTMFSFGCIYDATVIIVLVASLKNPETHAITNFVLILNVD